MPHTKCTKDNFLWSVIKISLKTCRNNWLLYTCKKPPRSFQFRATSILKFLRNYQNLKEGVDCRSWLRKAERQLFWYRINIRNNCAKKWAPSDDILESVSQPFLNFSFVLYYYEVLRPWIFSNIGLFAQHLFCRGLHRCR